MGEVDWEMLFGKGREDQEDEQPPDYVPLYKTQPGKPAPPGSPLARARIAAHSASDPLWQSGKMTRTAAYSELARRLGIPKHQAHMQMFDIATCERVVALFLADEFETLDDDFSDLV